MCNDFIEELNSDSLAMQLSNRTILTISSIAAIFGILLEQPPQTTPSQSNPYDRVMYIVVNWLLFCVLSGIVLSRLWSEYVITCKKEEERACERNTVQMLDK